MACEFSPTAAIVSPPTAKKRRWDGNSRSKITSPSTSSALSILFCRPQDAIRTIELLAIAIIILLLCIKKWQRLTVNRTDLHDRFQYSRCYSLRTRTYVRSLMCNDYYSERSLSSSSALISSPALETASSIVPF